MRLRIGTRAAFALGVAAGMTVLGTSARADIQNWAFYKGAAVVKEKHQNEGNGMVGVFDVEVRRSMTAHNQKDMICDYQSYVTLTLPNGHAYSDHSPTHSGCNQYAVPGWFTFKGYGSRSNHDAYPAGSVLEGGWRDNHTDGEFKTIGSRKL